MFYAPKETIKSYYVPVLLGTGCGSCLLSLKIFLKTGIVSYICDAKIRPLNFLYPFSRFFRAASPENTLLLVEQLRYFSEHFPDGLPVLVTLGGRYLDFIEKNRRTLENYFLICDKNSFFGIFPAKN